MKKQLGETGEFILHEAKVFDKNSTEKKGFNDFVSYVDKGSEKMLTDRLSVILPEAGFVAEEGTIQKTGMRYCWVVDPLDGTTNFVHGLSPFAISIGLKDDDEIVAGVVYEITSDEMFVAWKEGGAWLNGEKISVSDAGTLKDSLIATGFPYYDFERLAEYMNCLTWLCKNTHGIRRIGSAATDLAYVACGRFEVFYEYSLKPWDICAGIILVREAGGVVTDFSGSEKNLHGNEIIASNKNVFNEVQEIVSNFMVK